jgi:hypothetical protein
MNTETENKTPAIKTVVCAVTKAEVPSNNTQMNDYAARYDLSLDDALNSYVSQLGRRQIKAEGLDEASVIEKYGVHPNVTAKLRCITRAKVRKPRTPKVKVETVTDLTDSPEVAPAALVEEGESVMITPDDVTE